MGFILFLLINEQISEVSVHVGLICDLIISVYFSLHIDNLCCTVYVTYLLLKTLDSQTCTWMENSFDPALAEELLKKECILQGI